MARLYRHFIHVFFFAAIAVTGLACAPMIGDECETHIDCGTGRICDFSQPGGYCTISNCTVSTCPSESICVQFTNGENWCMATCSEDSDCRDGYACVADLEPGPFCGVDISDENE